MRLSLSEGTGGVGRSGDAAGGPRAPGGDNACPSLIVPFVSSANRNARAISLTLSVRLSDEATRSRPEWNDGDLGMPSGETTRRGLVSPANIARESARVGGPAWTIAGGGRQRHPSVRPAFAGCVGLRRRPDCRAALRRDATARATPPLPLPSAYSLPLGLSLFISDVGIATTPLLAL